MTKIYTRTGDAGETGLFGGGRVPKDHVRVEAYGTVDELSAFLGGTLVDAAGAGTRERLTLVQEDLFAIGATLATPPPREGRTRPEVPPLPVERIAEMEAWMDEADADLPPLRRFILPGGSPAAAGLHMARAVCRRAERAVVRLARDEELDGGIVRYLNRLADLLFVLARVENAAAGVPDVEWQK